MNLNLGCGNKILGDIQMLINTITIIVMLYMI